MRLPSVVPIACCCRETRRIRRMAAVLVLAAANEEAANGVEEVRLEQHPPQWSQPTRVSSSHERALPRRPHVSRRHGARQAADGGGEGGDGGGGGGDGGGGGLMLSRQQSEHCGQRSMWSSAQPKLARSVPHVKRRQLAAQDPGFEVSRWAPGLLPTPGATVRAMSSSSRTRRDVSTHRVLTRVRMRCSDAFDRAPAHGLSKTGARTDLRQRRREGADGRRRAPRVTHETTKKTTLAYSLYA